MTNSKLGPIGSTNLPQKTNFQEHKGLLAITGKSNFDISEWMLLKMPDWLNGQNATLAMLCKTSVARKVLGYAWKHKYQLIESRQYVIDAYMHFDAAVDACLLVCRFKSNESNKTCKLFASLSASALSSTIGYRSGLLVADINTYNKRQYLFGKGLQWRSGIKHDCSKGMELRKTSKDCVNQLGEEVDLEDKDMYPMLKSSELVHGKHPTRWMVVTQKEIGEDTSVIKEKAPKTWQYLLDHSEFFAKRESSIYKNKPPFSIRCWLLFIFPMESSNLRIV